MSEPIASQFISRRRLLWLAAMAAAVASPASVLPTSDARAQTDQAPAAEPGAPKKKNEDEDEDEDQENHARSYNRSSEQSAGSTKAAVARRNIKSQGRAGHDRGEVCVIQADCSAGVNGPNTY